MRRILCTLILVATWTQAAASQERRDLLPLPILAKDKGVVKLQKEKLNAAVAELNVLTKMVEAGKGTVAEFVEAAGRLKDAAVDLNDPKLTMKIVNDYVGLLAEVHRVTELRVNAGNDRMDSLHRVRYYYLDAQILQLRQKKQLDAK